MADKDIKLIVEDAGGGFTEKTLSPGTSGAVLAFDTNGAPEIVTKASLKPISYAENGAFSPLPSATGAGSVAIGTNNTASNGYCSVLGGFGCTASGYGSVAFGMNAVASGQESAALGGNGCVASGNGAVAMGGNNTASGASSAVVGGSGAVADKHGQVSHAAGPFNNEAANIGGAQTSVLVARGTSSNEYQTELFLDGTSARCVIPTDTTWTYSILVVGRRTDVDGESAGYKLEGVVENNDGALSYSGVLPTVNLSEYDGNWNAEISLADQALKVLVTGGAGKTIRWVARITLVEVTG